MRMRSVCLLLLAGLVLAGCDSDCPTPTSPSSPGGPGLSVASLTISGPSELQVGSTAQLTATAHYSDGSQANVTNEATWVTNNVNICTVSESGLLKAVAKGVCTVTAVIDNTTGTKTITIVDPNDPNGPPASPPSGSGGLVIEGPGQVNVGQQIQLRAFTIDGRREVTDQANWTGNNPGAATVAAQGRVTGRSNGYVTVTASFEGKTGTKQIKVGSPDGPPPPVCGSTPCPPPPPTCGSTPCPPSGNVTALAISGTTSVAVGGTSQLRAIATVDGASQDVTNSAEWSSANAGIASVNGTGLVTGKAKGSTPITAAYGGKTATVTFNVTDGGSPPGNPTTNSLGVTGTTPMTVGQTAQYNAVAHMSDGTNPNVNGQAQWTSSNTGVATVSSTGVVTAKAAGTTQIRATYQGKSGTVNLTVQAAAAQREIIGLKATLDANVLQGTGGSLNLNLADLLNDPLLDLHVYALYNNGDEEDVTSSAVVTADDPLLRVDTPGVVNLAELLVRALLDPEHYIYAKYGGYTVQVLVRINVPVLGSLPISDLIVPALSSAQIAGNAKLPNVTAVLTGGAELLIPADTPGLNWVLAPTGVLGGLLSGLGKTLGDVLHVTGGTLKTLNLGILDPILGLLGGVLSVDVSSAVGAVQSAVQHINIPL